MIHARTAYQSPHEAHVIAERERLTSERDQAESTIDRLQDRLLASVDRSNELSDAWKAARDTVARIRATLEL